MTSERGGFEDMERRLGLLISYLHPRERREFEAWAEYYQTGPDVLGRLGDHEVGLSTAATVWEMALLAVPRLNQRLGHPSRYENPFLTLDGYEVGELVANALDLAEGPYPDFDESAIVTRRRDDGHVDDDGLVREERAERAMTRLVLTGSSADVRRVLRTHTRVSLDALTEARGDPGATQDYVVNGYLPFWAFACVRAMDSGYPLAVLQAFISAGRIGRRAKDRPARRVVRATRWWALLVAPHRLVVGRTRGLVARIRMKSRLDQSR